MLEVGKRAPAFKLPSADGSQVSLADFKGKNVVLYFYPKDSTPGCTVEAQEFQKALPLLKNSARVSKPGRCPLGSAGGAPLPFQAPTP